MFDVGMKAGCFWVLPGIQHAELGLHAPLPTDKSDYSALVSIGEGQTADAFRTATKNSL